MKVIIAGSRTIHSLAHIYFAIAEAQFIIDEIVCGMAPGVDMMGLEYAKKIKFRGRNFLQSGA